MHAPQDSFQNKLRVNLHTYLDADSALLVAEVVPLSAGGQAGRVVGDHRTVQGAVSDKQGAVSDKQVAVSDMLAAGLGRAVA